MRTEIRIVSLSIRTYNKTVIFLLKNENFGADFREIYWISYIYNPFTSDDFFHLKIYSSQIREAGKKTADSNLKISTYHKCYVSIVVS